MQQARWSWTAHGAIVVAAVAMSLVGGCRQGGAAHVRELEHEIGYAPGHWRIDPSRLNYVRLSLRHILITHRDAAPHELAPMLSFPNRRSRTEALQLAIDVAHTVVPHPDAFARVAEKYSDDETSRRFGGRLGVVEPLSLPDQVLDAVAALKEGQVSRPVETEFGFHIVQRLPVPPETRVAARRILLRHRGVPKTFRAGAEGSRSRDEALALARSTASGLRRHPEAFLATVARLTDATEEAPDGDIGAWSTHEGSGRALAGEVLAETPVGGVVGPLETGAGLEILQRVDVGRRERLAARAIRIVYDAPGAPRSRDEARTVASELARELSSAPARFREYQEKYCGPSEDACNTGSWEQGRGPRVLERALLVVPVGAVAPHPVELRGAFLIVQRDEPPAREPETYSYEMPNPDFVPFEQGIERLDGTALAEGTRRLAKMAATNLGLRSEEEKSVHATLEELARAFEGIPAGERMHLMEDSQRRLRSILGDERLAALVRLRETMWHNYQLGL